MAVQDSCLSCARPSHLGSTSSTTPLEQEGGGAPCTSCQALSDSPRAGPRNGDVLLPMLPIGAAVLAPASCWVASLMTADACSPACGLCGLVLLLCGLPDTWSSFCCFCCTIWSRVSRKARGLLMGNPAIRLCGWLPALAKSRAATAGLMLLIASIAVLMESAGGVCCLCTSPCCSCRQGPVFVDSGVDIGPPPANAAVRPAAPGLAMCMCTCMAGVAGS